MVLDSQNMLQVIKDFPKQCREALSLPKGTSVSGEISNIVVTGMGGSAIGGDLLKIYLSNTNIPVYVNRDYKVPSFVDENSLVFAVSYSGNTEETLSAYQDAYGKKATFMIGDFIRKFKKLKNEQNLIRQIKNDIKAIKNK